MQTIVRNSLISRRGLEQILSLPEEDAAYVSLLEILAKFQDIKKFASEIHTEIHLIKPILKILGYAYESKPKYFNDSIKGPDVALFATEADRDRASPLWGTPEYYANTLGVLLLQRFGRNREECISERAPHNAPRDTGNRAAVPHRQASGEESLPAQRDSGLQEKDGGLSQDRGGAL